MSGAYGLSASPVGFISHPIPKEIALVGQELRDISAEPVPQADAEVPIKAVTALEC